jgi:hypothetical protein
MAFAAGTLQIFQDARHGLAWGLLQNCSFGILAVSRLLSLFRPTFLLEITIITDCRRRGENLGLGTDSHFLCFMVLIRYAICITVLFGLRPVKVHRKTITPFQSHPRLKANTISDLQ